MVQCLTEALLNICLTVPKSTADVQLDLMEQESADTRDTGQTSWIATGSKLRNHSQWSIDDSSLGCCSLKICQRIDLRCFIRRLGAILTISQKLEIAKKRERLRSRVDAFNRTAWNFIGRNIQQSLSDNVTLLVEEFDIDEMLQINDPLPFNDSLLGPTATFADGSLAARLTLEQIALAKASRTFSATRSATEAIEHVKIPSPSTLGASMLKSRQLESLLWKEYQLRQGQANDALQGVRVSIANLSFEYSKKLRKIKKSKVKKTRAWAGIQSVGRVLHHHRLLYAHALIALEKLGDPYRTLGNIYK